MPTNNTALRRTDGFFLVAGLTVERLRLLAACAILLALWVSFRPFGAGMYVGDQAMEGGDKVNQIGYSAVGALGIVILAGFVDRRLVASLLGPLWIALLALVLWSSTYSPLGPDATRAAIFSLIGVIAAVAITALAQDADRFCRAFVVAATTVLAMSYAGIILYPDAAIHSAAELESQHAGFWRGIYSHKNVTGPMMAVLAFGAIALIRRGRHWSGAAILAGAMIFMMETGSKTTVGLVPLIVVAVLLPALMGLRFAVVILVFCMVAGMHALTVGTAFSPFLDTILRSFDPTTTFTGRTDIWMFAGDHVAEKLWTGHGFAGFWGGPAALNGERAIDFQWDPRGIVHAHNGFLDVLLTAGLPGLALTILVLFLAPLVNYLRCPPLRENVVLADFFMMVVAFVLMNSALESYFFRRVDPVWVSLVIAVIGLRMTARWRIAAQG